MVYVWARQMYLRDRVAAVSNRIAQVDNGQPLEVLEHGRRFVRVKTAKNEIGWIEERAVITADTYDKFNQLVEQHKNDPVVATGVVRDEVYLHVKPGRDADRFYLLAANTKVQLLTRVSVVKTLPNGQPLPKPVTPPAAATDNSKNAPANGKNTASNKDKNTANGKKSASDAKSAAAATPPPAPEPPPMEDWWLVRDGQGRVGWLLFGRVDIDVPDEIGTYAEGQRMVGAYLLNKVTDSEAPTPDHQVAQYVTILSPPRAGLPFDFDQVRVFTWSMKHHRYETAYRLRPIQGYFPLRVASQPTAGGAPGFSFQLAGDASLMTDPATGQIRPAHARTVNFALLGERVVRTGADQWPIPVTHQDDAQSKTGKNGKNAKAAKGKKK